MKLGQDPESYVKPSHVAKCGEPERRPRDPYEYAFTNILERVDLSW